MDIAYKNEILAVGHLMRGLTPHEAGKLRKTR